jgi:hypothetical protein
MDERVVPLAAERRLVRIAAKESISMNPAITAAIIAATRDEDSEEYILAKLRTARAQAASSAIALEFNDKQQKLLEQALGKGIVVKTVDGRFYLNQRALSERKEGQGYMALLILVVVASAIASMVALTVRSGG